MQALEMRLLALEQAIPATNTGPVFIHLVAMGSEGAEINRITKGNHEWLRKSGESEQDLKDRAQRESQQNPKGVSTFLCYSLPTTPTNPI